MRIFITTGVTRTSEEAPYEGISPLEIEEPFKEFYAKGDSFGI